MDSNENRPLTEAAVQEAVEVATVTEVTATPILSKEDIIARLQALNEQEAPADKTELDVLKQTFYLYRRLIKIHTNYENNEGNIGASIRHATHACLVHRGI